MNFPIELYQNLTRFINDIKTGNVPETIPTEITEYNSDYALKSILHGLRSQATAHGMWALVDKVWTKQLADWIGNRKVLEVMAGAGWLAKALNEHGVDITATDDYSWDDNHKHMRRVFDVHKANGIEAVDTWSETEVLIVSWPPFDDSAIIEICNKWGSDRPIIYIGEIDGCNAGDDFFCSFEYDESLYDKFDLKQWDAIHDVVLIGYWNPNKYEEAALEYRLKGGDTLNRDHIISAISDDFKDAHGFRPRGMWDFDSMSDSELIALSDRVYEEARLAYKEEEDRRAQSAKRFEELVLDIIRMGAGNRQTALRWLFDTETNASALCFEYDLPYSYKDEFKAVISAQVGE